MSKKPAYKLSKDDDIVKYI